MVHQHTVRPGRVRYSLLAMAVAVLAACGGDAPTDAGANGSIRGTVTENTGAIMEGVAVQLTGNGQPARSATSDDEGVYTFADVPPGSYVVSVSPPAGLFLGGTGKTAVTVASGAQASASPLVLSRTAPPPDTCAIERPDFGEPANAADRSVFAYDASAPLNLTKTVDSTKNGIEFSKISFESPAGGTVPGELLVPVGRSGPRPGMVVGHPGPGPLAAKFEMAALAQRGAVVIMIHAPYIRRGGPGPPTLTAVDRPEQIQMMKDLQRAVDVLLAQPNVDPARIGYAGFSYGGMIGVHFAGIERRLKAAVISSGYGGSVTMATSTTNLPFLVPVSCANRAAWFRENVPIEPVRFISGASPVALLFQVGKQDNVVLLEDQQAAYNAASSPKEVIYYDTGHGLNNQATTDRFVWLAKQIGIDPLIP